MKNFLKQLNYIFEGYYCLILRKLRRLNKQNALLYDFRYMTCQKCEKRNKLLDTCSICGCWLPAKTSVNYELDENRKSINGCPEKRW